MSVTYNHKAFFQQVYAYWDRVQTRPWESAVKPVRLSKHSWYLGDFWVGVIMIDTGEGLVLIDAGMPGQTYLIFEDMHSLGYSPKDIKLILVSHGHYDHCGALKAMVEYTGAKVWAPKEDLAAIEGRDSKVMTTRGEVYQPVTPDYLYDYKTPIHLGNMDIEAFHTPGHTNGSTSFFYRDDSLTGAPIRVGVLSGLGLNGSIPDNGDLTLEPYCSRRAQYRHSLELLRQQHVDVTASLHPQAVESEPEDPTIAVCDSDVWLRTVDKYLRRLDSVEHPV